MTVVRWRSGNVSIPYKEKHIPAVITQSRPPTREYGVILTHGAGGDMNLPQLVQLAQHLAGHGFLVLRFTCKGLNLQHRINVYKEVLKFVKAEENFKDLKGCFLGGRSMGARAAVGVSSDVQGTSMDDYVKGVICISYPLHTPKDTANLRDAPISQLTKSSLFVSGNKDEMCKKELMETVLSRIPACSMKWIPDADHSLKAKGQPETETVETIGVKITEWLAKLVDSKKAEITKEVMRSALVSDEDSESGPSKGKKRQAEKIQGKQERKKFKREVRLLEV